MALITHFLRRPWLLALLVFAAAAVPVAWFHREWTKDARQRDQHRLAACAAAIRDALLAESIRHQHLLQSWRGRAESAADCAAWQRALEGDSEIDASRFGAVGIAVWAGAELKVCAVIPVRDAAPFPIGADLAAIPQLGAALAAAGKKWNAMLYASEPFAIPQLGERVVTLTGFQRAGDERGVIFAVLSPVDFLAPAETTMHRMNPDGSLGESTVVKKFLPHVGEGTVTVSAVSAETYERALHGGALDATLNFNSPTGRLLLIFTPGPNFGGGTDGRGRAMLGAGLAVAALLALLAWMQARQRTVLAAAVAARTAELSRTRDDLHTALENERELVRLKSQFVNTVSHEFRTPLGVILSSADILAHYLERLPAEQRAQHLRDIHDSSVQMSRMLEQVLDLGRMDAGALAFHPKPLDLAQVLSRIADESRSACGGNVRLSAEGALAGAAADETLLRHIFLNLLSNARKYSDADAVTDFTVLRERENAVFTVRDRGIGIPAGDLPQMFEAFARGRNVAETPGTGLGLAIVQRCVALHGGTIGLASTEDGGTTVTVRLPLFAEAAGESSTQNPP